MALAFVVVAALLAYTAGGLALWFGAGWLVSLLILSGVGTATILILALGFALLNFDGSRSASTASTATDPAH